MTKKGFSLGGHFTVRSGVDEAEEKMGCRKDRLLGKAQDVAADQESTEAE